MVREVTAVGVLEVSGRVDLVDLVLAAARPIPWLFLVSFFAFIYLPSFLFPFQAVWLSCGFRFSPADDEQFQRHLAILTDDGKFV